MIRSEAGLQFGIGVFDMLPGSGIEPAEKILDEVRIPAPWALGVGAHVVSARSSCAGRSYSVTTALAALPSGRGSVFKRIAPLASLT